MTSSSSSSSFFMKLTERSLKINSILCVGLDPHRSELLTKPEDDLKTVANAAEAFCVKLIENTHHCTIAYKPNIAFFEALGSEGIQALERVLKKIPQEIPVILDCKRGDISTTAEA